MCRIVQIKLKTMDASTLKYQLTGLAEAKMSSSSAWGGRLALNCLPVSMEMLQYAKETWPDARVAIGHIRFKDRSPMPAEYATSLLKFTDCPSSSTEFHAWIVLDSNDLLDMVAPSFAPAGSGTENRRFVDQEAADEDGITYTEVITDPVDVMRFYEALKKLRPA